LISDYFVENLYIFTTDFYSICVLQQYPQNLSRESNLPLRGSSIYIHKYPYISTACRYDDPPWSDCDPFEMIRYRTLHLIHGGRQCDEYKNMTKHCTPYELPPGLYIESIF
jgi:hypothetical protein